MGRTGGSQRSKLGRPRRVEDDAVFAAVGAVLLRVGLPRLGLNLVADEVGVTPAALRQRFGGKTQLLIAYQRWATEQVHAQLTAVLADRERPPLDALRGVVRSSAAQVDNPDHLVNALSAYTDVAAEPRTRTLTAERLELAVTHTAQLLDRAIADGTIGGIGARQLAEHLQRCLIGTCLTWSISRPRRALGDELAAATDLVLAPYLRIAAPIPKENP